MNVLARPAGKRPWLTALLVALAAAASPKSAAAFSDPERFGDDTVSGGAGGRYFTGSPVDGFGCNVCHRGGEPPSVTVRGLPITGYVPGTTYDVEITWKDVVLSHGAQLELIARDGKMGGMVSLPDERELDARARCGGSADQSVAAYIADLPDEGRTIIGVRSCDARSLRFRFTAPDTADIAFAGGIVRADDSATAEGDGFVSLNRVLYRQGEAKEKATKGCALTAPETGATGAAFGASTLIAGALLVRRRRKRVR